MEEKIIELKSEYITLGQVLKAADVISSGGMAKWYLSEFPVFVNQVEENRRGRKLYDGDVVELPNEALLLAITSHEN